MGEQARCRYHPIILISNPFSTRVQWVPEPIGTVRSRQTGIAGPKEARRSQEEAITCLNQDARRDSEIYRFFTIQRCPVLGIHYAGILRILARFGIYVRWLFLREF